MLDGKRGMSTHLEVRSAVEHAAVLRPLIEEQRLGRYALFFVTSDGEWLPNGIEEATGYVLDERGRIFSFELGWDAERCAVALTAWDQVEPEGHWLRSAEYQRARAAVGLGGD